MQPVVHLRSGRCFNLLDPDGSSFTIDDIAWGLANTCRFGGQTRRFYSVAEHSVNVLRLVPPEYAMHALFHDAAEAIVGDVPSPLKHLLPDYQRIENSVQLALEQRLPISAFDKVAVKHADLVMLAAEREALMPDTGDEWDIVRDIEVPSHAVRAVLGLRPEQAHARFTKTFLGLARHDMAAVL